VTAALVLDAAPDLAALARPGDHRYTHRIVTLADGSTVSLPVIVFAGRNAGPRILAIAGVHGDEMEGIVALQEVAERLDPGTMRGTVVLIPVGNPPAFRAARRRSPLDDLDLNRTFPGDPAGSPSQRLAYHLLHDYVLQADFVLSLHSWSAPAVVVPYVEFPAGDSPAVAQSLAAARHLGLEFLRVSHWHPGLLVATAVRHGIPAVETEIGGLGVSQPATRKRYVEVVLNLLRALDVLPGPVAKAHTPARMVRHVELASPVGGLLRPVVEVGDVLRRGERIATVHDLLGAILAEITSPLDGWLAMLRLCNSVDPAERVATLFEEIPGTGDSGPPRPVGAIRSP
jgi:predicted deacylase